MPKVGGKEAVSGSTLWHHPDHLIADDEQNVLTDLTPHFLVMVR